MADFGLDGAVALLRRPPVRSFTAKLGDDGGAALDAPGVAAASTDQGGGQQEIGDADRMAIRVDDLRHAHRGRPIEGFRFRVTPSGEPSIHIAGYAR